MNRKGQGDFGFVLLFFIMIAGLMAFALFIGVFAVSIKTATDVIIPEIEAIGEVGAANVTQYAEWTLEPIDTVIQSFSWLSGILYMLAIVGLFVIAYSSRFTNNRWLIVIYFAVAVLLLFLSILISNVYEDLYNSPDVVGDGLKEHVLLSYLVLHSPVVFSILIFASAIVLFTGFGREGGV